MVLGSFIFRLVYTIALRFNMPAFMLKLVSSVIVVLAYFRPISQETMAADQKKDDTQKRRNVIDVKDQTIFPKHLIREP